MALKKKKIAIGLIVFVAVLGLFITVATALFMSLSTDLGVYINDCKSISKSYLLNFVLTEILLTTFFVCLSIYIAFQEYQDLQKLLIRKVLILLSIHFLIIISFTIRYPLLTRTTSTWLDNLTNTHVFTNPLLYVSLFTSLLIFCLMHRFRNMHFTKLISRMMMITFIILLLGVAVLVRLGISVGVCEG